LQPPLPNWSWYSPADPSHALQLLLVLDGPWYPAGHSKQKVEAFAAVYLPAGQLWHSSKLRLVLNLPIGHGLCSWAETSAK
jgi:hypothetical protein